jgi:hypothetical protein
MGSGEACGGLVRRAQTPCPRIQAITGEAPPPLDLGPMDWSAGSNGNLPRKGHEKALRRLHVELVKLQRWVVSKGLSRGSGAASYSNLTIRWVISSRGESPRRVGNGPVGNDQEFTIDKR